VALEVADDHLPVAFLVDRGNRDEPTAPGNPLLKQLGALFVSG
jgi:hypothetical protein